MADKPDETPKPAESTPESRAEWIKTLDKVTAMKPRTVVAGHKTAKAKDTPQSLSWTRRYIQDFETAAKKAATAEELMAAMQKKYPKAALPVILQMASQAAKPPGSATPAGAVSPKGSTPPVGAAPTGRAAQKSEPY